MQWLKKRDEEGLKPMDRILEAGQAALSDAIVCTEVHDARNLATGSHPLHYAAAHGLTDAVESLLNDGFRPNSRDELGETALHTAVRYNRQHTVEAMLRHCRPNLPNNKGLTPLHWAVMVDNLDIIRALLTHGADPDAGNIQLDGLTPLGLARILRRGEAHDILEKFARTVAA